MIETFFLLLCGHALTDFALQSEVMAKGKNRHKRPEYIPDGQKYMPCWFYWLSAHALISGGAVYLITGQLHWGLVETVIHWIADFIKCENKTNPHQDQFLHIASKALYLF